MWGYVRGAIKPSSDELEGHAPGWLKGAAKNDSPVDDDESPTAGSHRKNRPGPFFRSSTGVTLVAVPDVADSIVAFTAAVCSPVIKSQVDRVLLGDKRFDAHQLREQRRREEEQRERRDQRQASKDPLVSEFCFFLGSDMKSFFLRN